MIRYNRIVISLLTLLIVLISCKVRAESWSLLMHTSPDPTQQLRIPAAQQQWLQKKQTLVVGILQDDSPPYDLHNLSREYEGLSADYIGLIAKELGLSVRIICFENNDKRWRALSNGDIDIIPTVTGVKLGYRNPISQPYASEQPVLAVKSGDQLLLPLDLADIRVAMVDGYLEMDEVKRVYPQARLQIYDSYQQALSAVAFGNAQVFLGSGYSIGRNYLLNNLRIERYTTLPERKISFAVSRGDTPLAVLIDSAITAIAPERILELQQFWHAGTNAGLMGALDLTPDEQRWVKDHPVVKVILYGRNNTAPVAFIDQSDSVRGIAADVLSLVGLKTGMKFSFTSADSLDALRTEVNTKKADMVAALASSDGRRESMLFSYPYTRSAFALITASDNTTITHLADLRGKKLALVKQAALATEIAARYPTIKILYFDNDQDLFNSVLTGKADAAIGLLITADYQISNQFHSRLKIVNTVGSSTAYISFAVGQSDPELRSVLNKVLMKIPPYELEMLANRWRPNNMVVVDSFWTQYRTMLISAATVAGLLLLLAIGRAIWLRREVKKIAVSRQHLADQLRLLEALVDGMPFPLSLRDLNSRLIYCNQLYVDLRDVPYESLKGLTLLESYGNLSLDQARLLTQKMAEVVATDTPYSDDHHIQLKKPAAGDEPVMTANIWLLPWHNDAGKVIGVVSGLWDVSEREKLVRQLSNASERAELSNRAKSTFLATMSHEIRTPMNAIIGMLDMALKKGKQGEIDLQALDVAYHSAEGLVGLIGDILDLARVEGGHLEFRPVRINLASLTDQLLVIFNGLALDKNITLHKKFPDEAVIDVTGDPLRIKQVLSNVLSNAIKFTDEGEVSLSLQQTIVPDEGRAYFRIEVQDSGVGINPAQLGALFQPFGQADNRRAGTGLGLCISRNLCQSMGGNLTLSSVQGEGTLVVAEIVLPIAPGQAAVLKPSDEPVIYNQPLRILVVDDNAANRILIAKQLAWLGHHIHIAEEGFSGLSLWQAESFDVIITDCNMPGMNGYQFTQRIRETEKLSGQRAVWIIGFTANAMQEIIDRCMAAGMNDCLFKPCTINGLAEALNNVKR